MPYFKKPTINLGNRQSGRLLASSIINCEIKKTKIVQSIKFIYSKEIKFKKKKIFNPYKITGASDKIVDILLKKKNNITFKKFFYDIK
jgi:GDP/UDP-N,N'-diacetylbacillosamine 2-epimerase (hydrolysing)